MYPYRLWGDLEPDKAKAEMAIHRAEVPSSTRASRLGMVLWVRAPYEVPAGFRPGTEPVGDWPVAVPGGVLEVRTSASVVVPSCSG